jgi:hypothetical protein
MSLSSSIDALYACFRRYRLRGVGYCSHCHAPEEQHALRAVPLRVLSPVALAPFVSSAMTTFGQLYDFKHFLPRILELIAARAFSHYTVEFAFMKLNYAQWRFWPGDELLAVERFLLAWWRATLVERADAQSTFAMLRSSGIDASRLLDDWLDLPDGKLAVDLARVVVRDPRDWRGLPLVATYFERAFFSASTSTGEQFLSWAYEVASGA